MKRRRVLTLSAAGLAGATAGCLDIVFGDDYVVPAGMAVDTHYSGRVLDDGLRGRHAEITSYHTLIADLTTAEERLPSNEGPDQQLARAFIESTDFTVAYLVIVEYGASSAFDLELTEIIRMNGSLRIRLLEDAPSGEYEPDWTVHSAIIRITDELEGVPEDVIVEIDGEPTDLGEV